MRTALLQLCVSDDPTENLKETQRLLREAARDGASFILTPEVTNYISSDREHQRATLKVERDDPTLAALREEASSHGIYLLIGSLALLGGVAAQERLVNRSFLVGPDGKIVGRYDKIHMFDVEISEKETYRESAAYAPGARAVVASTTFGNIGMCICYDMRFPPLSSALANAGAEILTFPSAFSPESGTAHWHALLRARAIETGCWVLAPAQSGIHPGKGSRHRSTYGHSLAVDPWGNVALDAGMTTGVHAFDLDMEKVADARRRIPSLRNTRTFDGP